MLTKEQRDDMRRTMDAPGDRAFALKIRGEDVMFSLPRRGRGDSLLIDALLDALDEMERERDRAAGTRDALANECNRVASALGIRDDDSSVLAIGALTEERDELADVLRSLGIRHRNEDGSKRTADEMWAELKARARSV